MVRERERKGGRNERKEDAEREEGGFNASSVSPAQGVSSEPPAPSAGLLDPGPLQPFPAPGDPSVARHGAHR